MSFDSARRCRAYLSRNSPYELLHGRPSFTKKSILDVVVRFLFRQPRWIHPVSDYESLHCSIVKLQAADYVLEHDWIKYQCFDQEWLYRESIKKCFSKYSDVHWQRYRCRKGVWWLNGKRWFWGSITSTCDFSSDASENSGRDKMGRWAAFEAPRST